MLMSGCLHILWFDLIFGADISYKYMLKPSFSPTSTNDLKCVLWAR